MDKKRFALAKATSPCSPALTNEKKLSQRSRVTPSHHSNNQSTRKGGKSANRPQKAAAAKQAVKSVDRSKMPAKQHAQKRADGQIAVKSVRTTSQERAFEAARQNVGSARPQDDRRPSQRHKTQAESNGLIVNIQLKNQRNSSANPNKMSQEDAPLVGGKLIATKLISKSNKKAESLPAQPKIFAKKQSQSQEKKVEIKTLVSKPHAKKIQTKVLKSIRLSKVSAKRPNDSEPRGQISIENTKKLKLSVTRVSAGKAKLHAYQT